MPFLREFDHLLLATPVIASAGVGAASGFMQQSKQAPVQAIGWFGCRAAVILGVLSGIPLLTYSFTKVLFAKTLTFALGSRFEVLKSFEEHAEMQFSVSLIVVSTFPVMVFALPAILQTCYKTYQACKELQKVKDEFMNSDFYKTMSNLYEEYKKMSAANHAVVVGVAVDVNVNADHVVAEVVLQDQILTADGDQAGKPQQDPVNG